MVHVCIFSERSFLLGKDAKGGLKEETVSKAVQA